MDSQNQKWVNLSYLSLAVLLGYVVFAFGFFLMGTYDLEAKVKNFELVLRIVSLLVGGSLFFLLVKSDQVNQYMHEVVVELGRVTWPTAKETRAATIVVMIMVLISGLVLSLLDFFWTKLIQMVL